MAVDAESGGHPGRPYPGGSAGAATPRERPLQPTLRSGLLIGLAAAVLVAGAAASLTEAVHHRPDHTPAPPGSPGPCKLVSGGFAVLVQGVLFICAVSALAYKRYQETPRRPVKIWAMDCSKQAVSSGAAHGVGMLVAIMLGAATAPDEKCGWYLAAFITDTSVGVYVAFRLLRLLERHAKARGWHSLAESGYYRDPHRQHDPVHDPDCRVWIKQLLSFVCIVLVARAVCATILSALLWVVRYPVQGLTKAFDGNPKDYLVFVMIIGPGFLNLLQAWIQDNFLARQARGGKEDEGLLAGDGQLPAGRHHSGELQQSDDGGGCSP